MPGDMDRIHRALDGELPRAALSPEEEAHLREVEGVVGRVSAVMREAPAPDLTARVMAALAEAQDGVGSTTASDPARSTGTLGHADAEAHGTHGEAAASPLRNLWRWFWNPVPVTVRPAYLGGGLALVLLAAALLPRPTSTPPAPLPVAVEESRAGEPRLYVQFRIEVPNAADVALTGSFTDWRAEHHLTEVAPGVWSIMLPLAPGVHDYAFVIDGERMVVDPYAPAVSDPFGGSNSRLFLPAPNGSA